MLAALYSRYDVGANGYLCRNGLIGDYDYAYLFIPRLPFTKQTRKSAPFFGLEDRVPVVLALILGLQHALAMLAGGEFTFGERRTSGRIENNEI